MKIAALVSGGVDSSVALQLLKEQGHDITAFYLKIWLEDELSFLGECPWEEDLHYVREICARENIPLEVVSLQKEYFETVVSHTIEEVKRGRTPNPDIMCNNHIKFGLFLEKIDPQGTRFEKVASGHYAQLHEQGGHILLRRSPDPIKDQTYFLARLQQHQLKKLMLPIGHLTKEEVRTLAARYDLPNKHRKDSQGICFLGKVKFREFIRHYLGTQKGDMIEYETGEKIGEHEGFWYFTSGQRQGIGLPGGPWYVVEKDPHTNTVMVSRHYHDEDKARNTLEIEDGNWFLGELPTGENLSVKLRHGPTQYRCTCTPRAADRALLTLSENDQGIAPGQYAVLYQNDLCLGSAVIAK